MLLLDTITGQFVEKDPRNEKTRYAILSHAWDSKGEQSYQELRDIQRRYVSMTSQSSETCQPEKFGTHHHVPFQRFSTKSLRSHSSSSPPPLDNAPSMTPLVPASVHNPDVPPGHRIEQPSSPIWDDPELSPKIRMACAVARANGYRYIWIDSCCIDKTSSSELSEAINSMYQWYTHAEICYAFLADVKADEDPQKEDSTFRRSRWFTRGWTLQELIASAHVQFLAMSWTSIGSKCSLAPLVSDITNINYTALLRLEPLNEFSVAQRLSWASRRQTTRIEDGAYSLLGIFDINMPILYGEGERAFRRLQEEIMRRIPDQSLFAWSWNDTPESLSLHYLRPRDPYSDNNRQYDSADESLLAPSIDLFADCGNIEAVPHSEVVRQLQCDPDCDIPTPHCDFTSHGIRMQLPMIPLPLYILGSNAHRASLSRWYLLVLGCEHKDLPGHLLGRICHIPSDSEPNIQWLRCACVSVTVPNTSIHHQFNLLPLSPTTISQLRSHRQIDFKTIYIPHPSRTDAAPPTVDTLRGPHQTIRLVLLKKARRALYAQGYTASLQGSEIRRWTTHRLTIEYNHTLANDGRRLAIQAHVQLSGLLPGDLSSLRERCEVDLGTILWTDSYPWASTFHERVVMKQGGPGPKTLPFKLVLDMHLATQDHYIPYVKICDASSIAARTPVWRRVPVAADMHAASESSEGHMEEDNAKAEREMPVMTMEKVPAVSGGDVQVVEEKDEREDAGRIVGQTDIGLVDNALPFWWVLPCDF